MPLDNSNYISQMNPSNPNGAVDTVNMLDDAIREVKRSVVNSLPNLDGQVEYSTEELNNLRANFVFAVDGGFDCKENPIKNVKEFDDDAAVQPRLTNDKRYPVLENNFSDLKDKNECFNNLFSGIDYNSDGVKAMKRVMVNLMYPIGYIYVTMAAGNPRDYLGEGTWEQFGAGRAMIGVGSLNDGREARDFTAGNTGGTFTHTLSVHEMPAHNHGGYVGTGGASFEHHQHNSRMPCEAWQNGTGSAGGNGAHNNMQPYVAVYMWRRIA